MQTVIILVQLFWAEFNIYIYFNNIGFLGLIGIEPITFRYERNILPLNYRSPSGHTKPQKNQA